MFVGAELHQGRAQQKDTVLVHPTGGPRAVIFFFEDQPFDQVQAATAVVFRPCDHAEIALGQCALPLAVQRETGLGIKGRQTGLRHMALQPLADFQTKSVLFGRKG